MNKIIDLYLDYVNNVITLSRFAELHNLDEKDANIIIEMGRKYNERLAELKTIKF